MVVILEILKKVGIEKFLRLFYSTSKIIWNSKRSNEYHYCWNDNWYSVWWWYVDYKSGKIDKQSVFLSVSLLNLLHAVIEDTILMALIGGHISGILFARIIFSLIVSYLIFMITKDILKLYKKI